MLRRVLPVVLLALVCAAPVVARAESDTDRLLRRLGDPAAQVREQAAMRLRRADALDDEAVVAALEKASVRTLPVLLEVAGLRGIAGAAPRAARAAAADDPVAAQAAIRTLVLLGDAAVTRGLAELSPDRSELSSSDSELASNDSELASHGSELAVRRSRLRALAAQDVIERDLLSRWRRKGGSYDGRFALLAAHGWPVQPLLFAMLLDVPLEARYLAMPDEGEPSAAQKFLVLHEIRRSERRGYRTFRGLPATIDDEDLFDLAAQALRDVVDVEVLGNALERLVLDLEEAHHRYRFRVGFQLRQFERYQADAIAEVLARHGRKEHLQRRVDELTAEAEGSLQYARRAPPSRRPEAMQWYATDLTQLAGVLHQMREFDRAADLYGEAIEISTELGGSPPGIASYNRACALARGGRTDESLRQLDTALQADTTDLSRAWVEEDGDLHALRDDPRFKAILDRAFGP